MKLIDQKVTLVTENNPYKCIELAGRVSHKSEAKITTDSYKQFFIGMLKVGHTATLEFGDVYLRVSTEVIDDMERGEPYFNLINVGMYCPYCKVRNVTGLAPYDEIKSGIEYFQVYTNLRFILDEFPEIFEDIVNNGLPFGVETFIPDRNDPYRRYCFHIITNRGISHELVRHRVLSFLQESTRYVKYGDNMEIITPEWFTEWDVDAINDDSPHKIAKMDEDSIKWYRVINTSEKQYSALIGDCRLKPQQARGVLPNDLKTEMYITGYLKDWIGHTRSKTMINVWRQYIEMTTIKGFDTLRNDIAAHPQAREIARMVETNLRSTITDMEFDKIKNMYV